MLGILTQHHFVVYPAILADIYVIRDHFGSTFFSKLTTVEISSMSIMPVPGFTIVTH